jgi:hypothetical protein
MDKIVPIVPEDEVGGNTSSPTKKQVSPAIKWCFTLNNYTEKDIEEINSSISSKCSKFIFETEIGENGTAHLQGYIAFKKKSRWSELGLTKNIHWEKVKGSEEDNIKYCSKDYRAGVKKCRIWKSDNILIPSPVKIIETLRPFQRQLLDILLGDVNEGKIIWIYDEEGQMGKTQFLRYMNIKYGIPFTYGGKCADIVNLAFNNKDYLLSTDKAVMIYNFGRDTDNRKISYKSMEQISDGAISNTKFETGCFCCNPPHVVVLANCCPNYEALTLSRWIVKSIDKDFNLVDLEIDL